MSINYIAVEKEFISKQTKSKYLPKYEVLNYLVCSRRIEEGKIRIRVQLKNKYINVHKFFKKKSLWSELKEDHYSIVVGMKHYAEALADAIQAVIKADMEIEEEGNTL